MMKEDRHGRMVHILCLEVNDPPTKEDEEIIAYLLEFLSRVGRDPVDLSILRQDLAEPQLPILDASGLRFKGGASIRVDFIISEEGRHRRWVTRFPKKSDVPLFGHPFYPTNIRG
jgi:hypothetical protein